MSRASERAGGSLRRARGELSQQTVALIAAMSILAIGILVGSSPKAQGADPVACPQGWAIEAPLRAGAGLAGVEVVGAGQAWAVGGYQVGPQRWTMVQYWDGTTWSLASVPSPGDSDTLTAVSAVSPSDVWAVGSYETRRRRPLALHFAGGAWTVVKVPSPETGQSTANGVAAFSASSALAVGQAFGSAGQRPIARDWDGSAWRRTDPPMGDGENGALLGVAGATAALAWAVGWVSAGQGTWPLIFERSGASWSRTGIGGIAPAGGALTNIAFGGGELWAVGYQYVGTRIEPLVLRLTGSAWAEVPGLQTGQDLTILRGVAVVGPGVVWVVGTRWDADHGTWRPFSAQWDGTVWTVDPGVAGIASDAQLLGIDAPRDGEDWLVGETGKNSLVVRTCTPPPIATPSPTPTPTDTPDATPTETAPTPSASASEAAAAPGDQQEGAAADRDERFLPTPTPPGSDDRYVHIEDDVDPLPEPIDPGYPAPLIGPAVTIAGLTPRDVAAEVGIVQTVHTWGGVVADFNADRWPDVFLSRHIAEPLWLINDQGAFHERATRIPVRDRHLCDAGDVNMDGRIDVYCTLGGERGLGLKSNELWLQELGPPWFTQAAPGAGLADPLGRGRDVVLFDADDDGDEDLFVGNAAERVDALPSPNRLFRNDGGAFVPWPELRVDMSVGTDCAASYDFDDDGRRDLLFCAHFRQGTTVGVRLFRNRGTRFVDVTARRGIVPLGEVDAEMADIDRDGRLDLIQLSVNRLRVSLWRSGAFVPVYERSLTGGRALATGRVDGNRYPDIYIVRGLPGTNPADLMLLNTNGGRAFTSMSIPQTSVGSGESVLAIDHDRNGRTDFLVLNGKSTSTGPIQLIAFFPNRTME